MSMQDRRTVCAKRTIGSEIVLDAPDGTPGDKAQVEARFGMFGDCANLDARLVHSLPRRFHRLRNRFGCTQWYSKVTRLKWKLNSVYLEIVLILTQDRYMVCAKHTKGSEIVLDAPHGTPR